MNKVLILGGTGAMGKALVELLDKAENEIYITSRKKHESSEVVYLQGDAHDFEFLDETLSLHLWDSIVDFMVYQTSEFENVIKKVLPRTKQYIFISSARVYAPSDSLLTEDSPRLLDVCQDQSYVSTNEYALAKAREEDILLNSTYRNWTIVRPSLTYNDNRLQFALWDKEGWLYRALNGKSIVFPKNMMNIKTTMSYGGDVSAAIARLICNDKALGENVHIAGAEAITWAEVLNIYANAIEQATGKKIKIQYIDDWEELSKKSNTYYQAKYARAISREFSSEKLNSLIGELKFISPEAGLTMCVQRFIDEGSKFGRISYVTEGLIDRITKENSLNEFNGWKQKCGYILARCFPFMLELIRKIR